jgi:hypothetical protein
MTMLLVKQQLMKAEADVASVQKEQQEAQTALAAAQRAASESNEKPLPQDADAADRARDERFKLDRVVYEVKARVLRAGFALRRADQAAKEARERRERMTAHAAAVDSYAKAEQAVRDADAAVISAVVEFVQGPLAKLFQKRDEALTAAVSQFNSLPSDVRVLDVNRPDLSCIFFGAGTPPPPEVFARVGRALSMVVTAPHAPVGKRPTPWAEAGRA